MLSVIADLCRHSLFLAIDCVFSGKTTLMDVIAGRKTAGKVEGSICVNGHPQSFPSFNRLMGYVEQTDIHVGMHTVREAIEFSAKLRLPSGVTDEARGTFVELLLDELELRPLADRIVGDANVEGLSPGELKRLTIAVEMAANPALLFLDEPSQPSKHMAGELAPCRNDFP
jgi:ABC-type multidrug transport system ATPase subunit